MRMRQSFAQFEAAFREETVEDRLRRDHLRREAAKRSVRRREERFSRHSTGRFVGLCAAILVTTGLVTVLMFQMLSLWFA